MTFSTSSDPKPIQVTNGRLVEVTHKGRTVDNSVDESQVVIGLNAASATLPEDVASAVDVPGVTILVTGETVTFYKPRTMSVICFDGNPLIEVIEKTCR
jgi:hypothetical protein